jgi:hypothetical protein
MSLLWDMVKDGRQGNLKPCVSTCWQVMLYGTNDNISSLHCCRWCACDRKGTRPGRWAWQAD